MWSTIRTILITIAAIIAAGLLFVNVYNSIVDAPNWGSDIPNSINVAREYFKTSNPGHFFRIVSPANQIVTLVAVIFVWPLGWRLRIPVLLALAFAVCGDVFTFAYFYPRNGILFALRPTPEADALRTAWNEWSTMNWLRSGFVLINVILDHVVLARVLRGPSA